MNLLFNRLIAGDLEFQIIAGLIGIASMIAARLLDWYFPTSHHRHLDDDEADEKDTRIKKRKKVETSKENNNE